MRARLISLLGPACAMVLCAIAPSPTPAAQVNTTANECQPFSGQPENFGRSEKGIFTQPDAIDNSQRDIVCSVPRSPDIFGGGAYFYVDGDNFVSGAIIGCTLVSWSESQLPLAEVAFWSTDAHYDIFLSFAAEQLDPRGFVTLNCLLPPQGQGMLRGVTSIPQEPVLL